MNGCESNDIISEDVVPLPARPQAEAQPEVLETSAAISETVNDSPIEIEARKHCDDQTFPKQRNLQVTDENYTKQEITPIYSEITAPHENWPYNLLIMKLSRNITDEEFRQMKEVYKGKFPRGYLDGFKNPLDLFDMMQKTLCLSPVNLLQLEGLFWHIGRLDLMNMVIEYARKTSKVTYMEPASLTPVNGYTRVKFHVRGKNFGEMTKEELLYLRTVVANILLIPSDFVLIDGVDPSSSIIVTMLIPDLYAGILQTNLAAKEMNPSELINFGIDSITIGNDVYPIAENHETTLDAHREKDNLDVFVKLQQAKDTITNLEEENMKQMDTIKQLEKQNFLLEAKNDAYKHSAKADDILSKEQIKREPFEAAKSAISEAQLKFVSILEEISKDSCNKRQVLQLLQVHAELIAARCYREQLEMQLQEKPMLCEIDESNEIWKDAISLQKMAKEKAGDINNEDLKELLEKTKVELKRQSDERDVIESKLTRAEQDLNTVQMQLQRSEENWVSETRRANSIRADLNIQIKKYENDKQGLQAEIQREREKHEVDEQRLQAEVERLQDELVKYNPSLAGRILKGTATGTGVGIFGGPAGAAVGAAAGGVVGGVSYFWDKITGK